MSFEEFFVGSIDAKVGIAVGINASNEEYLERHPYASREYYSLGNFDMSEVEIIEQKESAELTLGGM